ncbi:MAG: TOBE domain-containing protein, partial [Enterobacterales bacterium]|nr:TOBE domain-containing protein [Enterobacterales bacterium]
ITDVSISLDLMPKSSILNQLQARVVAISKPVKGYQFVSFDLATKTMTARLTAHSVAHLALKPEQLCYVCFKTPRVLPLRK